MSKSNSEVEAIERQIRTLLERRTRLMARRKQEPCVHEDFDADIKIARITEPSLTFVVELKVKCTQCRTAFEFLGLPVGLDLGGACVSFKGDEARLAITPLLESDHVVEDRPGTR